MRRLQVVDVDRPRRGHRRVDGIDDGQRPVDPRARIPRRRDLGLGQVDVLAHRAQGPGRPATRSLPVLKNKFGRVSNAR
jgi:hypothetical protein